MHGLVAYSGRGLKSVVHVPQVKCAVPVGEPIFQPFPPEVTFHNYEPFQTYEATLYLRNNDNVGTPNTMHVGPC